MRISLLVVVFVAVILAWACPAGWTSTDYDAFAKLERENTARELYLKGEAAYKRGAVEDAVSYWMKVMELKPDSTYTAKCLISARQRLWADYLKRSDDILKTNDRIGAYMVLESVTPLLPDNADLVARKKSLTAKMSQNEIKALEACKKVLDYFAKDCPSFAEEPVREALSYASRSRYVQNLSVLVAEAKSQTAAGAVSPASGTPAQATVLISSRGGEVSLTSYKLERGENGDLSESGGYENFETGQKSDTSGSFLYIAVSGEVVNNTDKPVEYAEIEFELFYKGQKVSSSQGRLWDAGGPIQAHSKWRFTTEDATGLPNKCNINDYEVRPVRLEIDNSLKTGSTTVQ